MSGCGIGEREVLVNRKNSRIKVRDLLEGSPGQEGSGGGA